MTVVRGKSGPALGGTEYRLMKSACRLIVRAKLWNLQFRYPVSRAKAKYSSSVVPPDPSVHFYHWLWFMNTVYTHAHEISNENCEVQHCAVLITVQTRSVIVKWLNSKVTVIGTFHARRTADYNVYVIALSSLAVLMTAATELLAATVLSVALSGWCSRTCRRTYRRQRNEREHIGQRCCGAPPCCTYISATK